MSGALLFTLVIFMKVDGRQHFIILLMFVLNFVLFFNFGHLQTILYHTAKCQTKVSACHKTSSTTTPPPPPHDDVIFSKIVWRCVDACVEFCFLKKQFLNLTIYNYATIIL